MRCIISLGIGTVSNETLEWWLDFITVLLQLGYSCHFLTARKEIRALVFRTGAELTYVRIKEGFAEIYFIPAPENFFPVHMQFSAVLSLVPKTRSMWECRENMFFLYENMYVLPRLPLDRAQIPWCGRDERFIIGRKASGGCSQLEERSACGILSKDESGWNDFTCSFIVFPTL